MYIFVMEERIAYFEVIKSDKVNKKSPKDPFPFSILSIYLPITLNMGELLIYALKSPAIIT